MTLRPLAWSAVGVLALGVASAALLATTDGAGVAPRPQTDPPSALGGQPSPAAPAPGGGAPEVGRRTLTPPAPAASAPAVPPRLPALDPVRRATEEARAQLDAHRALIESRCPRAPGGGAVTLRLTFDAGGREIARGVSEDRRAPAGELARCLRELQGTALAISPPGATVAVAIPFAHR